MLGAVSLAKCSHSHSTPMFRGGGPQSEQNAAWRGRPETLRTLRPGQGLARGTLQLLKGPQLKKGERLSVCPPHPAARPLNCWLSLQVLTLQAGRHHRKRAKLSCFSIGRGSNCRPRGVAAPRSVTRASARPRLHGAHAWIRQCCFDVHGCACCGLERRSNAGNPGRCARHALD